LNVERKRKLFPACLVPHEHLARACCHSGLLNACAKATSLMNRKIKAIVDGTHTLEYSEKDVEHVGDVPENTYETPELYFNHCTGQKTVEQLRNRFGSDTVHDCFAGSELDFEI
jgi:metal-dependent hydrolase (beta-lactamase superfamily II)